MGPRHASRDAVWAKAGVAGACHTYTWRRREQQRQCGGGQLEQEDRQPDVEQGQVNG